MTNFRAAAIQLNSTDNVEENLEHIRRLLTSARNQGANIALLPENFAFMGSEGSRSKVAEDLNGDGPICRCLTGLAKDLGMVIVGGGMPERSPVAERPYNTSIVIDQNGKLGASYRKIHLFDVDLTDGTKLSESSGTTPGGQETVYPFAPWSESGQPNASTRVPVGITICYDIRFPELYRRLVNQGAKVLLVSAAFTLHTGRDHWEVLLRARAIESQSWVIAAAQWGKHPLERVTYGRSMIIDPWGTVVAQAPDQVGLITADIDLERLETIRATLPSLKHRRL